MTTPYVSGTVSVTAGSAVVTAVGTGWATALITGGMFGLDSANGNPVPIASIDSDTQLTLAKPWRGTTAATQAYWIMRDTAYGQQTVANAMALAQIINELRSAPLAALAGLTPAADKVPYFTSAGAAALTDIKGKGRDVLASSTTLELLSKLGPVLGGEPPTPSAAGVGLSDGDLNAITVSGVYNITGTWSNSPFSTGGTAVSAAGTLIVITRSAVVYQWLQRAGQPQQWKRYSLNSGSSWTDWLVVDLPVVGTVSNSLGYPNGSIIERGSNANGEYVRFADGTQICWISGLAAGPTTTYGNVFRSDAYVWTYPVAFSSSSTVTGCASAGNTNYFAAGNFVASTNSAIRIWSAAVGAGTTIGAVATGRWYN